MRINNINNQNFNGYKNVVSYLSEENKDNAFAYMAIELDNDNGLNDLENWKEIQNKLFKKENDSNVIIIKTLTKNKKSSFFVDNFILTPEIATKSSEKEYNILKLFSLVSSLTKRISNENFPREDKNLHLVLAELIKDLKRFLNNKNIAEELAYLGAFKKVPHYVSAEHINKKIQQKMNKYFKL